MLDAYLPHQSACAGEVSRRDHKRRLDDFDHEYFELGPYSFTIAPRTGGYDVYAHHSEMDRDLDLVVGPHYSINEIKFACIQWFKDKCIEWLSETKPATETCVKAAILARAA